MIRKDNVLSQCSVKRRSAVGRSIVIGKGLSSARLVVIRGEAWNALRVINARGGRLQDSRVDIGSIDDRLGQQPFLMQQNSERIRLFAGTAAGDPHLERGISAQQWHNLLAQRPKIGRIPKHFAHLHREKIQQCREYRRIVHDLVLQLRERAACETVQRRFQAPAQRCGRVLAKIIVIHVIDGVDQELEFNIEFLPDLAAGRCYFGIHTRTKESSFSTSSGLAM